jgi:hypothetical protein
MGSLGVLRTRFLDEVGKITGNNLKWLTLTWTSWNLDKHHIVKDSAEVTVSWPWNRLMLIIARLTVGVLY